MSFVNFGMQSIIVAIAKDQTRHGGSRTIAESRSCVSINRMSA
jgi:hypothetical protein